MRRLQQCLAAVVVIAFLALAAFAESDEDSCTNGSTSVVQPLPQ